MPLTQLRPSVAFAACSVHLPDDVDSLHGDDLIRSLSTALLIHSKARVVLQCWVLLIMRRQAHTRYDRDALYDRLQDTAVVPQERTRYRRGAMLLCHLLVERDEAEAASLLDSYLIKHYLPWSTVVRRQQPRRHVLSACRRCPMGAASSRLLRTERQQDHRQQMERAELSYTSRRSATIASFGRCADTATTSRFAGRTCQCVC